jgi:eukaryotic-like serine/threonine-protein kinase
MGRVYLAVHPGIGRQAAVKVLTPGDAADPQIVGRFITEARAANAIRHPNIVDIYDSGVLDGGTPYIVMEYLEGETLTQALARGPVALDDAIDWGCQVAEALSAAHAHDVVHRDLKPDNLFLTSDARRLGRKQVKVLDFGIAKLQRHTADQIHQTRTGSLLGTPLYMSPEQCMSLKNVDARTDIYSLGVILYEMVTGKRPFDADGVYAVISMHINDAPLPPTSHRADTPRDLEAVILRALAKAPEQRQESMAVLHSQLELTRGNTAASSDALARARQERLRPVPLSHTQAAVPEIKTLGDTAVSSQVVRRTAPGRASPRPWLLGLAAAATVLAGVYWIFGNRTFPPVPPPSHTIAPPVAAARPAPPPPATPAAPATVEIGLYSVPSGASVYVGDVLIGTTPGRYLAATIGEPVEFLFRLEGFAAERIRALPATGLAVTAKFTLAEPGKRTASTKHKHARVTQTGSSIDIQTER